jgi:hypothetical protein
MNTTHNPINGRLAYPNDPPHTLDLRTDEPLDRAPQRGRHRARLCWCGATVEWTGPIGPDHSWLMRCESRERHHARTNWLEHEAAG